MTLEQIVDERRAFLRSKGLSPEMIESRLQEDRNLPTIEQMVRNIEFIESLGLSASVFEKLPAHFGLSIEDNLKPKVDYITKELGLPITTFEKHPALFGLSIEDNLKPKVDYITKELGLPITTFEKLPALFSYSIEDNLKPKVDYITKELGLPITTFEKHPALFGYSLEGRIKPRVDFVALKGKDWQIQRYISLSDEKFCYQLGCSLEEYETFKKQRLNQQ